VIDGFILFFSLLSLLSLVAALDIGVILLLGRGDGPLAGLRRTVVHDLGEYALPLAAAVATTATLGSLFMSEVAGFVPCRLCWVQRGFMYPLALFLIAASVKRLHRAWMLAVPWAILGGLVSIFHYAEQREWIGGSEGFCDAASPCTDIWVWQFGFMSIPFMALTGFAFVAVLMAVHATRVAESSKVTARS
jgi:disulfide bond formation protein DsbB